MVHRHISALEVQLHGLGMSPIVGDVLPSCWGAGPGLEPGIPAHAWDVQSPLGDISSSCSGYACGWVLCKVECQVRVSTVCSCHFGLGLVLFPLLATGRGWNLAQTTAVRLSHSPKMCAWPSLLLLLHSPLCMNPIFQYMNSVFQCKNPVFWEFMNPVLWYINPSVQCMGFASTRASGRSDAFALSGSSSLTQLCLLSSSRQLYLRTPRSPLPLLLLPSQSGTL